VIRLLSISIGLILCFQSCQEDPQIWKVNYEVRLTEPGAVEYRVRYTNAEGATELQGPIENDFYLSDTFLMEDETALRFSIERISGEAELNINVLRDGAVHATDRLGSAQKELEIETVL
jgi:hypothetical protein